MVNFEGNIEYFLYMFFISVIVVILYSLLRIYIIKGKIFILNNKRCVILSI